MGIDQTKVANVLDGFADRIVAQHAVSPFVEVLGVGITRRAVPVPKNRQIGLGIFESIQVASQGGEPLQLVFMLVAADFFAVGEEIWREDDPVAAMKALQAAMS